MRFRALDQGGDWVFGSGAADYARFNQAIGLNIKTRIQSWRNDCFFDQQAGIDWVNRLGSKNQRELLEQDLRRIIAQTDGVTAIFEFDTLLNGRNFTANYTVETVYSASFTDTITIGA